MVIHWIVDLVVAVADKGSRLRARTTLNPWSRDSTFDLPACPSPAPTSSSRIYLTLSHRLPDFLSIDETSTRYAMPTTHTRKALAAKALLTVALLVAPQIVSASYAYDYELHPADLRRRSGSRDRPASWGPPTKRGANGTVPLIVSNLCSDTIWPGIGTQAGTGPGTGGFELAPGTSMDMQVSKDWQGRVWGRTNCSFAPGGLSASNANGNNGAGAACGTGDCGGVLNCVNTVSCPLIWRRNQVLTNIRVQLQSPWQNLISQAVAMATRCSTIYPS